MDRGNAPPSGTGVVVASASSPVATPLPMNAEGRTPVVRTNDAGEAIFKIVAVSYAGSGDWVQRIRDLTRPENAGKFLAVVEHDAWRVTSFDFLLAGITVQGHPVRFYLYGHEGIGFVGQPGTAKDVVYKSAETIVALASDAEEQRDLVSVVGADLTRLESQGQRPTFFVALSPAASATGKLAILPDFAHQAVVEWRTAALDLLKPAVKQILVRYR